MSKIEDLQKELKALNALENIESNAPDSPDKYLILCDIMVMREEVIAKIRLEMVEAYFERRDTILANMELDDLLESDSEFQQFDKELIEYMKTRRANVKNKKG